MTPIPLPTWTDPRSVASLLTSLVFAVIGVATIVFPPAAAHAQAVNAAIPSVSILAAFGVQFAEVLRHGKVHAAAVSSAAPVVTLVPPPA